MKILIIGAGGKQGQRLVAEALNRGHLVTAAVRDPAKISQTQPGLTVVVADALDAASVAKAARGHDVVMPSIPPHRGPG